MTSFDVKHGVMFVFKTEQAGISSRKDLGHTDEKLDAELGFDLIC